MSEQENEPLIPRPPLEDEVTLLGGEVVKLNRDNTTLVFHQIEQYQDMDHVYIRRLGSFGIKIFGLHAWTEYLMKRGYDLLIKQYPDEVTVATWLNHQSQNMEKELNGAGGELDELDED